jgi:hypothetical protein
MPRVDQQPLFHAHRVLMPLRCRGGRAEENMGLERAGGEVYPEMGHLPAHGELAAEVGFVIGPPRQSLTPPCAFSARSLACGVSTPCP